MRTAWRTARSGRPGWMGAQTARRTAGADGRATAGRSQGQTPRWTPVGTAASVRRAVELADGRPGNTAVRQAVGYADGRADGQRMATRTGRHISTDRNGHPQHQDLKPPPSVGRSGFYSGVKFTKSGFQRTSPLSGGRRTSGTSDVLTTLFALPLSKSTFSLSFLVPLVSPRLSQALVKTLEKQTWS